MSDISLFQRFITGLSGGFVLAFHEIPPELLAGFVDCIRPAQPVHLSELVRRSKEHKSTSGLFAITVDDGVGENVRALAQLFRARAWPATFYIPTRYLDTGEGLVFQWWRRLKPLLPRRRLDLKSGVIDLTPPGAIDELSKKMELLWHSRRLESYLPMTMEVVEIVLRESGMTRAQIQPRPPITWPEVAELSKNDLIRFESHGVSHAAMSSLTEEELVFEMKHSRDVVAEHTGRPCRHLAYPFGNWQSIGPLAAATAERFYDSAVTMSLGRVDFANPWLLPRIPLYPENSTLFAQLKILLKCSALGSLKSDSAAVELPTEQEGRQPTLGS
jgi:peptidoglycan/xylan/chitin deacetylase (PgdA/CDA1 family)